MTPMSENSIHFKIHTEVKPKLIYNALWRGTFIGAIGAAIFFVTFLTLPLWVLTKWGWAIVIISLGLMAYGVIPYRLLTVKDFNPDILFVDSSDVLRYITRGKIAYEVPISAVQDASYYDDGKVYGIAMHLKDFGEKRFPYFSEKSTEALQRYLKRDSRVNEN